MGEEDSWTQRLTQVDATAEKKLRRVFMWSASISFLVLVYMLYLSISEDFSPMVRVLLLPLMFWSSIVTVYAFRSVSQVGRQRSKLLKELANRDTVTGAYSNDYLLRRLRRERLRAKEKHSPCALAHVKVTGVQRINERYGHTMGNQVLRGVAQVIEERTPPDSVVARLGGVSFAVLFPGSLPDDARPTMNVVWRGVHDYTLSHKEHGHVTGLDAAVVIGKFPGDAHTAEGIVRAVLTPLQVGEPNAGVRILGGEDQQQEEEGQEEPGGQEEQEQQEEQGQ